MKTPSYYLKKFIVKNHRLLKLFIPDNYSPYHFNGGQIYLNIKESPMMFKRALGIFEIEKTKAITSFLQSGMTFIDIGANKGDFSLLASRIVGENGLVLSIEPEPSNCKWIRESIQLNGYKNIMVHELALSNTNGETQLYLGDKSGWHTLIPGLQMRNSGEINVKVRTLDDLVEESSLRSVDIIKIDVEGAESQVLQGALQTLVKNKDIILLIDLHPQLGVNLAEVFYFLNDMNISIHKMEFPYVKLDSIDKNTTEIIATRNSQLFIEITNQF